MEKENKEENSNGFSSAWEFVLMIFSIPLIILGVIWLLSWLIPAT